MPRNIEIKARIENLELLAAELATFADQGPTEIQQDDTFFNCESGRLKLRAFSPNEGELIFYRRADQAGPKESFYVRSASQAPDSLRDALSLAYGESGRVKKLRLLYLVGRTRVHLDIVEDLGQFIELEVVLQDTEPASTGEREARQLMQRLGIAPSQLIDAAYVDLLRERDA
jgi:predicted adenylyl cyclase CyaB